jgi:hypothetical protein
MTAQNYTCAGVLTVVIGGALILAFAGAYANSIRSRFVFAPHEYSAEQAVRQVEYREKSLYASTGNFVAFSNAEIEKNASLLGLSWSAFPVKDYFFDAIELESGDIRLRALPRPESAISLSVRPRLYIAELSPKGELVHSGWYPSAD